MSHVSHLPVSKQYYKEPGFDTIQLHAGHEPDIATRARAVPIYASTSFEFKDSAHGAEIFKFNDPASFSYTRISNPTTRVFETRMAKLEGGLAAIATASGQAAQFLAISAITSIGDNIISTPYLYGGSYNQLKVTFKKFGVDVKFVTELTPEAFEAQIDDKTKAIFVETVTNPQYFVFDLPALAKISHAHGIPLIVDNTFGMGGYLIRPFEHGADIIVHSATKWIGGHGTTMGGAIIYSGKFDWRESGRFPGFTEPTENYHDLVYLDRFGPLAYIVKVRAEMMRDIGACVNPFGSFLLLQGLETLSLRGHRHCTNAMELARWLEKNPHVAWVSYLGLESHPSHEMAKKILRPGLFGSMLNFGIKGNLETANKLIDSLRLVSNLANVGDAKTLIIIPGSTTHNQLSEEELQLQGVTDDLIRVSTGIEDIEDIIADFNGAFDVVFGSNK